MSAGTAGRSWNHPDLQAYIESPVSVREYESLDEEQMVLEKIMLALRTSEGISASYLKEHCDPGSLSHALASGNLVCLESGNMCIPENRFFISDSIISDIV
jgi:coproporphyrinogen III oxidase-like Fe-S oxidoreductase